MSRSHFYCVLNLLAVSVKMLKFAFNDSFEFTARLFHVSAVAGSMW